MPTPPARPAGSVRTWAPGRVVDLAATLGMLRRGGGDPAFQRTRDGATWLALRTPDGPVTLRLVAERAGDGTAVTATAWGHGAGWVLDGIPELLGDRDDLSTFRPAHPLLRDLARRATAYRVPRTRLVLHALVPAVLEQKVVGVEGRRAWRWLLLRFGEPAPGPADARPAGLRVPPDAATWRQVPSWDWHRAGVEGVRSRTIVTAAAAAGRLEALVDLPADAAEERLRRLQLLPGIGAWTAAEVAQRAFGDADAVSVGDYHVPRLVGWALAGERDADDARMLELLEPYRPHRYRVQRLLELGAAGPPRRGPRMSVRDYRTI